MSIKIFEWIFILSFPILGTIYQTNRSVHTNTCLLDPLPEEILLPDSSLVYSLIHVESRGNDSCVGDRHLIVPSIGCLQIRPIMVREVNRILKHQDSTLKFKYKDRWSRKKSIAMFYIWKDFHHPESSNEKIARNWNGGPKGYKRKRTMQYWEKVQKELSYRNEISNHTSRSSR